MLNSSVPAGPNAFMCDRMPRRYDCKKNFAFGEAGWGRVSFLNHHSMVTDNGANMKAMSALPAMRYPGPIPLRCAAHSLQLVIKDMLLQPLLEVLQLGVQSSCERFQGS